ncbi:tRNA dihydrouridine synthase DusB [uncultured Ruminococcus sp.]|uniref:tRNA dihydrouridine synthase DusB n=1 Tax=uncultured Ruminococcus sp. TaxID=165186 RepID=UPI00292CB7F7|nr:tRNA dihydrouridine synthase DusB [uncultured Ruminococcus sp.]
MQIGNVKLSGYAALAPMAGVADRAFRELCMDFGAGYCVSEMVSSKGIAYHSKKSAELMEISDSERPCAVQIFGTEPDTMADAARFAMQYRPEVIDINMGCPAPKIAGSGSGAALMRDPELCGRIVQAVSRAVEIPVTVKIRSGFDGAHINAVEVAKIVEKNGAQAVTVHGRTKEQFYAPPVNYDIIREVKRALSIPVIGNGDVCDAKSAQHVLEYTGCDYLMVGRGALGNPWVFREINEYFDKGIIIPPPTLEEKCDVLLRHISAVVAYKGEFVGMREARKHTAYYLKGFKNAAKLRNLAFSMETKEDLNNLIREIKNSNLH